MRVGAAMISSIFAGLQVARICRCRCRPSDRRGTPGGDAHQLSCLIESATRPRRRCETFPYDGGTRSCVRRDTSTAYFSSVVSRFPRPMMVPYRSCVRLFEASYQPII